MSLRILLPLFAAFFLAAPAWSGIEKDLGRGLTYYRVSDLGSDAMLSRSAITRDRVIIDLRSTRGTTESINGFVEALEATPNTSVSLRVILVNSRTEPALRAAVTKPRPRQLTLGPRDAGLKTDITVAISEEDDQKAYAALESGTPIEKLISSNREKRRFDEAALVRTHANGSGPAITRETPEEAGNGQPEQETTSSAPEPASPDASATPNNGTAESGSTAATEPKSTPLPPIHDLVLERALQIHRALEGRK